MSTNINPEYSHLLTLLHPSSSWPQLLEIEILPSSHSQQILSAPPSIGIPKKTLLSCFLHARQIFQSHKHEHEEEPLLATKVLTLWEPDWNSAWAFRRRRLYALRARANDEDKVVGRGGLMDGDAVGSTVSQTGSVAATTSHGDAQRGEVEEEVERELAWVETLVTSPLDGGKHAKSSWVWAHRMWVMKTFHAELWDGRIDDGNVRAWVKRELEIVMIAGERHPRNYYAWEYARGVIRMGLRTMRRRGWEESVRMVHRWCLTHPRDISGWTFLVFLLDQTYHSVEYTDTDKMLAIDHTIKDIFQKSRDFVEKFQWRGESMEWFIHSATHLQSQGDKPNGLK